MTNQNIQSSCRHGVNIQYTSSKIVELNRKSLNKNYIIAQDDKIQDTDFYKIIKTQIQHKFRSNNWKTIAITSPNPREGKTTTAINLAISMAKDHDTTIMLVDCDLKNQQIHKLLGYSSEYGITDHLIDDIPLEDIIVCPNINRLTIISGGKTINGSTELLSSIQMLNTVEEIKQRYDNRLIIFDVPCLLSGADTIAFLPYIDSVAIVIEQDKTTHTDIDHAINLIPVDKITGFILNKYQ